MTVPVAEEVEVTQKLLFKITALLLYAEYPLQFSLHVSIWLYRRKDAVREDQN